MLDIKQNVDIKEYCTLRIGGMFHYFTVVKNKDELVEAVNFAKEHKVKFLMLGGGSNLVFTDGVLEVLAIKMEIKDFKILDDTSEYTTVYAGAGVSWDSFVAGVCDMGLSGVESLSAIPGTVGATPVQNVGAYGQEVKNTIVSVEVFDTEECIIKNLSNEECKFSYRDSIFKHEGKGKYIITAVVFRLLKSIPEIPHYPGVKKYFIDNNINTPTLPAIRNAIVDIRKAKLPNPKEIPNVGSFFKNPIVEKDVADNLKDKYPELTIFPVDENNTKIPAGWLIEQAGLKGKDFGPMSVYKNNALVLVNNGSATYEEIINTRELIVKAVYEKFSITLEQEPEIVK